MRRFSSGLISVLISLCVLAGCRNNTANNNNEQSDQEKNGVVYRDQPIETQNWAFQPEDLESTWPSEYWASIADDQLQKLSRVIAGADGNATASINSIFVPQTSFSGWQRGQLKTLHDDGQIIAVGSDSQIPVGGEWTVKSAAEALQTITSPWNPPFQNKKMIFDIEEITFAAEYFITDVSVTIAGDVPDKGSRQATMMWKIRWLANKDRPALSKIDAVRIMSYDEVSFVNPGGKMFSDCTGSVLQGSDALTDQFSFGADQWADRLAQRRIMGWHGVSVADVNNDDLDDIYVCQSEGLPNRLFLQQPDGSMKDEALESGVAFHELTYCSIFADFDNDGDSDLVVALASGLAVLVNDNRGRFHFKNMLYGSPNAVHLSVVDFDNDNDLDLLACSYLPSYRPELEFPSVDAAVDSDNGGGIKLYRNVGGLRLVEANKKIGIGEKAHYTTSASWKDLDRDGDMDLIVANEFGPAEVYDNKGDWFAKSNRLQGFDQSRMYRGLNWLDLDQDGIKELVVVTNSTADDRRIAGQYKNDEEKKLKPEELMTLSSASYWLKSDEAGQWKTAGEVPLVPKGSFAMSSAAVDLTGDGIEDLLISNGGVTRRDPENMASVMWREVLPRFGGEISETQRKNLVASFFGFTQQVRAGKSYAPNRRNALFFNTGNNRLIDVSAISGLDAELDTRTSAFCDWDGDGDFDIVQMNRRAPIFQILRNEVIAKNDFVGLRLKGTESNRDAIGAVVEVYVKDNPVLVQELDSRTSSLCQSSRQLLFKIPSGAAVEKVVVKWPGGTTQEYSDVVSNQQIRLVEGETAAQVIRRPQKASLFVPGPAPVSSSNVMASIVWPKLRLPELEYQRAGEKWQSFKPDGRITIICLGREQDRIDAEDSLGKLGSEYRKIAFECGGDLAAKEFADGTIESAKLAPSSVDKLCVFGIEVFANANRFQTPCFLLLDGRGRLCSVYTGDLPPSLFDKDVERLAKVEKEGYLPVPLFANSRLSNLLIADYRRLAEVYARAGYTSESTRMTEFANPQIALALCQQSQNAFNQRDVERSLEIIDEAIRLDPKCREAYLIRGRLNLSLVQSTSAEGGTEQLGQALEDFQQVLQIDPENIDARLGLADISERQGDYTETLVTLDAAIRKNQEQKLIVDQQYRLHWIKGRLLFRQKKYVEAAKELSTAFDLRPIEPELTVDLALVYAEAGDFENALKFFELGARLEPDNPVYYRVIGTCNFILGNDAAAIKAFELSAEQLSRDRLSRSYIAWILSTAEDDSLRDAKRALELIKPIADIFGDLSPKYYEVYAAALAENGQFDQASLVQRKANDIRQSGRIPATELRPIEEMETRLQSYRKKKPWRMTDRDLHPFPKALSVENMKQRPLR